MTMTPEARLLYAAAERGNLWVISRHFRTSGPCPLHPEQRTLVERRNQISGIDSSARRATAPLRRVLFFPRTGAGSGAQ
jgi:hypothetical protein